MMNDTLRSLTRLAAPIVFASAFAACAGNAQDTTDTQASATSGTEGAASQANETAANESAANESAANESATNETATNDVNATAEQLASLPGTAGEDEPGARPSEERGMPEGSVPGAEDDGGPTLVSHGNASVPGQDLTDGDRTNPYDSTDDPTDPSFTPQASALKTPADGGAVSNSSAALSTTTGTTFDLTYYVVSLRPKGDPSEVTIRDCSGKFLTYASRKWRADAEMQGTARYKDSSGTTQTINSGPGCWIKLSYSQRWGLGVTNPATGNAFNLRPFRSIAIDRSQLTMGRWYYVKQLDGVRMPYPVSTMVHDGCVRAVDVGPAIGGRHIDFFSGYYSAYKALIGGSSTMGGKEQITLYDGAAKCKVHIDRGY